METDGVSVVRAFSFALLGVNSIDINFGPKIGPKKWPEICYSYCLELKNLGPFFRANFRAKIDVN